MFNGIYYNSRHFDDNEKLIILVKKIIFKQYFVGAVYHRIKFYSVFLFRPPSNL